MEEEVLVKRIRSKLDRYLSTLDVAHPQAEVFACLSRGLDSTGIAALAREHFRNAVAMSLNLRRTGSRASEDKRLAHSRGLSHNV